ncbi:uncharacterized protein [Cherax quadricarinatus]|uniref:uncharacterized protein isoform X2 n=1 Tax=Cherax quadricarinatus TaxID=27406 RepID=UPI00387E7C54
MFMRFVYQQIFSYLLHMRQLLFLVQVITQLYSIVSVELEGKCLLYFWLLLASYLEVFLRFLVVCVAGDRLLKWEALVEAAREVLCRPQTSEATHKSTFRGHSQTMSQTDYRGGNETTKDREAADQEGERGVEGASGHLYLHNLLCRMEARPLVIQVWGNSRLCGGTFVSCMGLVSTYLVVLLQLRPYLDRTIVQATADDDSNLFACFKKMWFMPWRP